MRQNASSTIRKNVVRRLGAGSIKRNNYNTSTITNANTNINNL